MMEDRTISDTDMSLLTCRFKSETGEMLGNVMDLPVNCTPQQLAQICNLLLEHEEPIPFLFFVNDTEITNTLQKTLENTEITSEKVIEIVYQQQAVFRVRPITRCTSSMPGHAEAVLSLSFSPDGLNLASGSGDRTVRFWDVLTQTPLYTCKGHTNYVLCVSWSPDSRKLASACQDGNIIIWNPLNGKQVGKTMTAHTGYIRSLSWGPYHGNTDCRLLASSSNDKTIRIWDTVLCQTLRVLSGHKQGVTCVIWGGLDLIYSASLDTTIKVWRASDGILCRTLDDHSNQVNTLALNTDYILRIGAFDPVNDSSKNTFDQNMKKSQEFALKRFKEITEACGERLVSGSDDKTLFLWDPTKDKKPIARLTGHEQLVNKIKFSPNGRIVASASFDKSVRLWQAKTGKFIATLRGHVQAVFLVSFSADSRYLVSGSKDSTLKLWNLKTNKLEKDLPGHADAVYALDWSTDGLRVASGGKDKVLKIWQY